MSSKIQILPDEIVNKIAAGEVVENPASVVKELVENSLDAQAENIKVHIYGGGLQKVVIQDDGMGMNQEDMLCSLKRHATSKIRKFEDLFHLQTMGFRGEALASIAAVSKMKMESALSDERASLLYAEGGNVIRMQSSSRCRGTTLEIDSLFYNVPARKRFQKSAKASTAEVHRIMTRLCLAYPEIGFELFSLDTEMIDVEKNKAPFAESLEKRIRSLFGESFFSEMIPLSFEDPLFHLSGFIGDPLFAKHTRASQYLFINRRAVFSPLVDRAVREGYGNRLSEGFHPVFVLHLQMSPEMVDVNVHPQKREVRLQNELILKQKIAFMISQALDQSLFSPPSLPSVSIDPTTCFQETMNPLFPQVERKEERSFQENLCFSKEKRIVFHGIRIVGSFYLGEMERTDLFSETSPLVFADLSGVYGRILFDSMERALLQRSALLQEKQALLTPLIQERSVEEMMLIEEKIDFLAHLGWEVRIMGPQTLAIDAIPSSVAASEIAEFFSLIVAELFIYGDSDMQKRDFLKKMAEKISSLSRKKRGYSFDEAEHLMKHLFSCRDPGKDPLGRPNFAYLQQAKIQELFVGGEKI